MDGIELTNSTLSFHAIAISTSIVLTIIGVVFVPIIKWIHDVQSKCVEVEKKAAESYPTKHEVNEAATALELRWSQHAARLFAGAARRSARNASSAISFTMV